LYWQAGHAVLRRVLRSVITSIVIKHHCVLNTLAVYDGNVVFHRLFYIQQDISMLLAVVGFASLLHQQQRWHRSPRSQPTGKADDIRSIKLDNFCGRGLGAQENRPIKLLNTPDFIYQMYGYENKHYKVTNKINN